MRSPAKRTFSSSSPMTHSVSYTASPFPHARLFPTQRHPPHDGCPKPYSVPTQKIAATVPRHCSTTTAWPSNKTHAGHDTGLCTSSPSLMIGTKNTGRDAKPLTLWQALPRCLTFTLNVLRLFSNLRWKHHRAEG